VFCRCAGWGGSLAADAGTGLWPVQPRQACISTTQQQPEARALPPLKQLIARSPAAARSSRRGTMEAASHLVTQAQRQPGRFGSCYIADVAQAERLRSAAAQTKTKALQAAVAAGIGFHNAAMEPEDRLLVRARCPGLPCGTALLDGAA
jgi:hypothetical protein